LNNKKNENKFSIKINNYIFFITPIDHKRVKNIIFVPKDKIINQKAVIKDNYKLIKTENIYQLFDINNDPHEVYDIKNKSGNNKIYNNLVIQLQNYYGEKL